MSSFPFSLVVAYYALLWYGVWRWRPATRPLETFATVRHLFDVTPDDADMADTDSGSNETGAVRAGA